MKINLFFSVVMVSVLCSLTACKAHDAVGKELALESINDTPAMEKYPVTLTLGKDGNLHGRSGCNNYFGSYKINGTDITPSDNMGATMMACLDNAAMEQERLYLDTLTKAQTIEHVADGHVTLTTKDGGRLVFRPLVIHNPSDN